MLLPALESSGIGVSQPPTLAHRWDGPGRARGLNLLRVTPNNDSATQTLGPLVFSGGTIKCPPHGVLAA